MEILSQDYAALIRDKYDGNNSRTNEIAEDVKRGGGGGARRRRAACVRYRLDSFSRFKNISW
jgi:hypothetical protein